MNVGDGRRKTDKESEKVVEGGKSKPHPHAFIHLEKYRLTKTTPLLSNPYQLVENNNAVWDDGVAPEVALYPFIHQQRIPKKSRNKNPIPFPTQRYVGQCLGMLYEA